jgi:hypothetical protein
MDARLNDAATIDGASAHPMLLRVQDPFGKLLVREKSRVVIGEPAILGAAEDEGKHHSPVSS